jgi:hypothetical protein
MSSVEEDCGDRHSLLRYLTAITGDLYRRRTYETARAASVHAVAWVTTDPPLIIRQALSSAPVRWRCRMEPESAAAVL